MQTSRQLLVVIVITLGIFYQVPHKRDAANERTPIVQLREHLVLKDVGLVNALTHFHAPVSFLVCEEDVSTRIQSRHNRPIEVKIVSQYQNREVAVHLQVIQILHDGIFVFVVE